MKTSRLMLPGVAALVIGTLMLGMAFSGAPRAAAVNQVPCGSTPVGIDSFGNGTVIATDTPIPTCTAVKLKTHTPTTTPTEAATSTQVPVTPAATQPAATATSPGGGAGGQEVIPPNTGTGAMAGGSGIELSFLVAGLLLLTLGSGSVLIGARRRA